MSLHEKNGSIKTRKVFNISLFITSIFVFASWRLTECIDLNFFDSNVIKHLIKTLINFIVAYGFFNIFANIIIFLGNKINAIKKWILEASYIEGIWVGYTLDEIEGKYTPRYVLRTIEQDLDNISVVAQTFGENLTLRTNACSRTASINAPQTLMYLCEVKRISGSLFGNAFTEMRLVNKGRATLPNRMDGTIVYLDGGKVCKSSAIKLSDLPHNYSDKELLEKAVEFYKEEESC